MKIKNNIKNILNKNNKSINEMATDLGMYYNTAHTLVNREDLSTTPIGTLEKVAEYLGVEITDLYKKE